MYIKWNERTWYSWTLSIIFFLIVLPSWTYYLGMQYQKNTDLNNIKIQDFVPVVHEQKVSDIEYKLVKVKGFDIPQLIDFKDIVVMKKVNSILMDIAQSFGCTNEVKSEHDLYNVKTKVTYAKNDIFSVSIHTEYYCGGPYPTNDSNQSVTFNLKNGEEVSFKDLFANYDKDRRSLMNIIFAKHIKETEIPDCTKIYSLDNVGMKTDMIDYSNYISYIVEDDGITAQPSFPHVIEVCSKQAHVSVDEIKEYINSSSILSWIK